MMEWLLQPWPWWLSGILIGLMVPGLYILSGKAFGISASLQHLSAMCAPNSKFSYLRNHNWRLGTWNLVMVSGIALGSFLAVNFLSAEPVAFLPPAAYTLTGSLRLAFGGVLVGFGTRYAGGCTSGHTIMGMSALNWPSLVATIFFFVGGLISTWFLLPLFGF